MDTMTISESKTADWGGAGADLERSLCRTRGDADETYVFAADSYAG